MNRPPHDRTPSPFRLWAAVVYVLALVAVAVAIGVMSVLLAAAVSGAGVPSGWDEVGQAFGVVNGVFSVLALMIVGVTLGCSFVSYECNGTSCVCNARRWSGRSKS
jgi:hypothetical protein